MLVSIIVPVFNVERYLRECLDSLKAQTLEDIEIICVDDGSTDGSLSILREYEAADSRFKVITKPNAGYGHTMNRGFELASAPYVGVLESDDFCDPNMCEVLYSAAMQNELDIVRCNISLYWSTPYERAVEVRYSVEEECGFVFDPRNRMQCFRLPPALCCMLMKKSILTENGLKLQETPGASYQDTAFSFKVWACAQRAMCLSDSFVHYRQDNEASSINQLGKVYCVSDEYAEIERFLNSNLDRFGDLLPVMHARKYSAYVWNYERMDERYHFEYAQHMAKEFNIARNSSMLEKDFFSSNEWSDLALLTLDPARYVDRMDSWSKRRVDWFHLKSRICRKLVGRC